MAHIPHAVYASLDAAMYPSQYERFAHYPHDIFEKYIQMIGVNNGEHIILYSRDDRGGMMYSAKFAWLLMSYGHDKVSILDGGFDAWTSKGNEVTSEIVKLPAGDWKAKDLLAKYNITFEEMQKREGGKQYMERTNEVSLC
ncbi:Rhodanese domain-containing protein, partial [Trichostrongylus colubriformis]